MDWIIMVSTLSGEKRNLCREREWARPSLVAASSEGSRSGRSEVRFSRIARNTSWVEESDTVLRERPGSCAIELESLGSATAT